MIRLVPPLMASCVMRHMRFKSDGRRTSGTGTLPKRFISQPYAGILKWDSSSHPRTNCGMAQYSMKGSNRLTWLAMKKDVRWASKPPERRAWTCAPERNAMRRQKLRCNQSCSRGSRKMPRKISSGTTRKKCKPLKIHRIALRTTNQARFIYRCPRRREECRVPGTPVSALHHRS